MRLTGIEIERPPECDEVEISLLGPGYGEAVVVHVGGGRWYLIDSCIDTSTGGVLPLEYLEILGVNAAASVECVVATHWHGDHVAGISQILRQCPDARFCASSALRSTEFQELVALHELRPLYEARRPMSELSAIMRIFDDPSGRKFPNIRVVSEGTLVGRGPLEEINGTPSYEVMALAPSDALVTRSRHNIAKLLPNVGDRKLRLLPLRPNDACVVLWFKIGDVSILLGADLETRGGANEGWNGVANTHYRSSRKAEVYKVAHHGSANADHPIIWRSLLCTNPAAILTPYINANIVLPTATDRQRIRSNTTTALISSDAPMRRKQNRSPIVERTIREVVGSRIRRVDSDPGAIRLRRRIGPADAIWSVELFGPASAL